jgi:hypothetical protein
MNKHILFVMDHLANPSKYTQEELNAAARAADDAYTIAASYADAASYAYAADDAYTIAASYTIATAACFAATYAAAACYAAAATYATYAAAERWVNSYFGLTSENKQDYIEALKPLRK